ncbi:MAG: nucleoside deaminase [Methylacidiphilaceae bacterium]|nr:nucleoside deaminase [Candidatus Methylacidiphilaceae bacterium]
MTTENQDFHSKALREAALLAQENVRQGKGGPFGAVIARERKVIARGINRVALQLDPTAHAEIEAIRAASVLLGTFDLGGCTLYTSCYPCPMCLGAIYWSRLDQVFFGASTEDAAHAGFRDGLLYREFQSPPRERTLRIVEIDSPECREALLLWTKSPNKILY